mgnify:FL=1
MESTKGAGEIKLSRGTITPVMGQAVIAELNFKVINTGFASISYGAQSKVVSSSSNQDILKSSSGISFEIK